MKEWIGRSTIWMSAKYCCTTNSPDGSLSKFFLPITVPSINGHPLNDYIILTIWNCQYPHILSASQEVRHDNNYPICLPVQL